MTRFTLIGRPTLVFRVVAAGLYAGIPCVLGHTLDGNFRTLARVADVVDCSPTESAKGLDL